MARSGGTLIAKCLGCMDNVVLLSEIHPYGSAIHNPLQQAAAWFRLFTEKELLTLSRQSFSFIDAIEIIRQRVEASGRYLVIRDWTHLDFTGIPFLDRPPYRLTTAELLSNHYHVIQTATVRHPLDQWISLRKLAMFKNDSRLQAKDFIRGYFYFAQFAREMGYLSYEDFTEDADSTIQLICKKLELPFDKNWCEKWSTYETITGDNTTPSESRMARHTKITPLPRQNLSNTTVTEFENNHHYRQSIELLCYSSRK